MSGGEIGYLALVLITFGGFSLVLATTSAAWEAHRNRGG